MSASTRTVVPVLLYHSIDDRPGGRFAPWTLTRELFAEHLDHLVEQGWTAFTITDLLRCRELGASLPPRSLAITVDDGFADFARNAWPELRRRGLPATLYVTAGLVGGSSRWLAPLGAGDLPMLDGEELTELAEQGCEIGAHSLTHPELDCLPLDRAEREVRGSKEVLEDLLDRPVRSFAYPHGYHDRWVRRLVVDAGFESACGVHDALSHTEDDAFSLARVTVMADTDVTWLERVLRGQGAPLARQRERLRTQAWRTVRRHRHRRSAEARP